MLTRIRLRRTVSSLNSLSNNANETHHLRYGEALYSFADNMMVVGTETDQVISNIPNRIIAFPKISKNLVFAGPSSGNNAFPTFRRLLAADMPDTYKSQGSATQPIYFNSSGAPTVIGYTIAKSVPSNAVFTDRYVNSIAFADDTTANATKPIKLTLTRAGSDTTAITGNIPKVSATSAGVAPKGATVSSQTQNTKFLREDGTWQKPSYTTNVNTTYTFTNGTDGSFTVTPSGGSAQKVTIGKPSTAGTADIANKIGSANVGSAYVPVYIKAGVPQQITANSALTNLASTTAASVFQQNPRFGVTGTLPVANGGTGKASWTANGIVYATAANALGQLAPAQANQVLLSNSSKVPTWTGLMTSISDGGLPPPTTDAVKSALNNLHIENMDSLKSTYIWDSMSNAEGSITYYMNEQSGNAETTWSQAAGAYTKYISTWTSCQASSVNNRLVLSGSPQVYTIQESVGATVTIPAGRYCLIATNATQNPYNVTINPSGLTDRYVFYTGNSPKVFTAKEIPDPIQLTNSAIGYSSEVGTRLTYGGGRVLSGWVTEIGPYQMYTHGKSGTGNSIIHLCRGSLYNILFGMRQGQYIGDGSSTRIISFAINNTANIPRLLRISHVEPATQYSSAESYSIDFNLYALDFTTLEPATPGSGGNYTLSWNTTACTQIRLRYNRNTSPALCNEAGVLYYWQALA